MGQAMENFTGDAIFVDASPDRVFSSLLTPEDALIWLQAREVTMRAVPQGDLRALRFDGSLVTGRFEAIRPPEEITVVDYFWERNAERRGPMTLRFHLEPRMGGVWLTVRQNELDSGPDWKTFARNTHGEWVEATVALKRHIEGI